MIKLIACDLDGTLLDSLQNISDYSNQVIHEATKAGIIFLIATGRDYYMVVEYKEQSHLDCDMILNNGAQYLSNDLKTNIYFPIDHNMLVKVVEILQKYHYHISMHTTNGKYIFEDKDQYYDDHIRMIVNDRGEDFLKKTSAAFFRKDGFLRATTQIENVQEIFDAHVEALKLDCKNENEEDARKAMEELRKINHVILTSSYERYVEVTSDKSHKGKLLQSIVQKYGFTNDEVAVFGDSDNDIQMLELFPNSYAPSNAKESVKAIVKEVIDSNDQDGVAKKIAEIIKENNRND